MPPLDIAVATSQIHQWLDPGPAFVTLNIRDLLDLVCHFKKPRNRDNNVKNVIKEKIPLIYK